MVVVVASAGRAPVAAITSLLRNFRGDCFETFAVPASKLFVVSFRFSARLVLSRHSPPASPNPHHSACYLKPSRPSCPSFPLPYLVLACPVQSRPIASYLFLPYPALAWRCYRNLPCLIVPYPVLLYPILSYHTLSCVIIPYPVLSCLTLPYPVRRKRPSRRRSC